MSNSHKPVLILGATSDVGRALAKEFCKKGHPIFLACRKVKDLKQFKKLLEKKYKVSLLIRKFDVLNIANHKKFIESFKPTPRIVICCVGLYFEQSKIINNVKKIDLIIRTNYIGPSVLLDAAAKKLKKINQPTSIVGISSVSGDRGRSKNYYYGSAKAGFTQYLSGLRQKLSKTKVHVMTVKPGYINTKMIKNMRTPSFLTSNPTEVAKLIVKSLKSKKNVVYSWKWKIIMIVINILPEFIFKKLKF